MPLKQFRTLKDVIKGADVFRFVSKMFISGDGKIYGKKSNHVTCANPDPEIKPELVDEVRSDAMVATGRSDYLIKLTI